MFLLAIGKNQTGQTQGDSHQERGGDKSEKKGDKR